MIFLFEVNDFLFLCSLISMFEIIAFLVSESMIWTRSQSMIFVMEINDFTSEIIDFMMKSLILIFQINDFYI